MCNWSLEVLAGDRRAYHRVASRQMSHDSPSNSPEATRASKADKHDLYDANIRNFAPVARIMKQALPENAKIAKEAKECMQECVSEFISFITSEGERITRYPPQLSGGLPIRTCVLTDV